MNGLRPKISVCMAAFNGSPYIESQLASILTQVERVDEVIVVDDASTDSTVELVRKLKDPRIRLIHNPKNVGPIRSFEIALRESTGELVFLSDQDDLWKENKVATFKQYFERNQKVTIALSDVEIIDREGHLVSASWLGTRRFTPGLLTNIIQNRYLGCAMVLRRSVLDYALPFPPDIPMHDMWIGMVNQMVGRTGFIDEPLISYRRHGNNATSGKHAPLSQMIRWRFALVKNLIKLYANRVVMRKHVRDPQP